MEGVPEPLLRKYFEQKGETYEIRKAIRDLVVFARQYLIQSPPFVKLDLISCRNVLIYFEPTLQKKVLEIFHYALKPGGLLFLGKSETTGAAGGFFDLIDKKSKIYLRKNVPSKLMPSGAKPILPGIDLSAIKRRSTPMPSLSEQAHARALEILGITGAVVDGEGKIQTTLGELGSYLKMPSGLTEFSIHRLLPKAAAVEVQVMLGKVEKSK